MSAGGRKVGRGEEARGRSRGRGGGHSSGRGGSGGGASPKPTAKNGKSRGLLIAAPHIDRFFAKIMERKTHEVRNFYCRVVCKNEQIYLVQSGLKDANGKGMFCVLGKAEFRGNTFVPHQDFSKHHAKHRCSAAEYSSVRSSWVDKGGCVLWELKLLEVFDEPLYFRPKQGEEHCTHSSLAVSLFHKIKLLSLGLSYNIPYTALYYT